MMRGGWGVERRVSDERVDVGGWGYRREGE